MNTSADNLLDEISQVFITKLNAQKLEPKFLQKLFDDLFKKVLFANKKTNIPNLTEQTPQTSDGTWSKKIKKAFSDLTDTNEYEKKYKQFLKKAFDTTKIHSLIPNINLDKNIYNNTEEVNTNSTESDNSPQKIIKEIKSDSVITKELRTETIKEPSSSINEKELKPAVSPQITPTNQQNKVSNKIENPPEREKEVKVTVNKEELLDKKTKIDTAKEQPTIIKELKTDSVVTNELKTVTNTEPQPPETIRETQTEIKNQPIVVKELKTDSVITKEVKTETIKDQPNIINELKSAPTVETSTLPNIVTSQDDDYEEGRANKIKENPKIQLDDITSAGQNALTNVLTPIFGNIFDEFYKKMSKGLNEKNKQKDNSEKGLLDQLTGVGSLLGKAAPLLAKIAGPVAAVVGGEIIGGQIGKMIGSNETVSKFLYGSETAGKEAYEKYGTGITGFTRASYDLYKQGQESKKQREEHQQMSKERVTQSKESMEGKRKYNAEEEARRVKVVEDLKKREEELKKQYEELKSQAWGGWNPFHDDQKETDSRMQLEGLQEVLTIQQNKLEQFRKLKTESNGEPKPPVPLKDGGLITKPTFAMVAEEKPELVLPTSNTFNYNQSKMFSTNNDGIVPLDKIFNSQDFSLNNTSLNSIVANTKDTNSSLKSLSDAMFKLVSVFDKKIGQGGNTTIINGAGGRSTNQPMPASAIANSNVDPIRRVRMQFA